MVITSTTFGRFLTTWFDPIRVPRSYVEGCELAPAWRTDPSSPVHAFRVELAAHVRDSSYPPPEDESQWSSDEVLRGLWYDVFGAEPVPDDPFPVPPEAWGRDRVSWYLLLGVGADKYYSSPGAPAWLAARGLSFESVAAVKELRRAGGAQPRPAPQNWAEHLDALSRAGRRKARADDSAPQAS